ncbi:MAG: TaqI-like C-terminal specificity domain-containing protein [Planctomycetales bacterium]
MPAPAEIRQLVERFELHRASYQSAAYNETQLRREFVDPFFKALGWDIDNEQGYAEAYKDVVHEDGLKIGGTTKAPDYSFRIGGARKFFVETKKPSVNVRDDVSPAFQLRRYAWTAKLPLSILTDFEEFAVYDCRTHKPDKNDKASTGRILYLRHTDYIERWDELSAIFSPEAIRKGSFDKYAATHRKKRGTAEVDAEFLKEIESWRELLARNLALRNPALEQRELNFAVQRTIDRIVFLRICEDRGIEPAGQLQALANGPMIYPRLCQIFERADERYNSGLFHFHREHGRREAPDELTLSLAIDDKPLQEIIRGLYYPDSPYEFSVFPADILGQVYEQFLGSVIRLTKGHQAKVEQKPEVRKAGGVYYTPTYIVDYIVEQTLGKLLEGKDPREVGGLTEQWKPSKADSRRTTVRRPANRPLAVLDPACGSGSFLIGAYQYLLDWHRDWYVADDPEKHAPRVHRTASGDWRLTTAERKRILLAHIHGVDIDPQAVEVTKLSLLLKVLEGENAETLKRQLRIFRERALPDLGHNIKCGNSLIGPDFFNGQQQSLFDEDQVLRVNAFDWEAEFPEIMRTGGFDAVIGNPPYLSFSGRQAVPLEPPIRNYYQKHYPASGWQTAHGFFIVKALRLTARIVGFIVPDQVGHLDGYEAIRSVVTGKSHLADVRYWGERVFQGVVTPALTFVADKSDPGPTRIETTDRVRAARGITSGEAWLPVSAHIDLVEKLRAQSRPLDKAFADPGVHTGNCSARLILPNAAATANCVPVLEGKQVDRYVCRAPAKTLRLQYRARNGEYFTIRPLQKYQSAPFVVRQTAAYPIAGPRRHADYFRNSLLALYPPDDGRDVRFVVAILNSRLMRYVYSTTVKESGQKAFPQVKVRALRALPIRAIDFTSEEERTAHDSLVARVDEMIELHARQDQATTPHAREVLNRRVASLDEEIDRMVENLYGLSEEEISQVETYFADPRQGGQ